MDIDKRLEEILVRMEQKNKKINKLRRIKRQIFEQSDENIKAILLEYEELETMEIDIATKIVYIEAVKDVLKILKKATIRKLLFSSK